MLLGFARSWVIRFLGGAWCWDGPSCAVRNSSTPFLMSSALLPPATSADAHSPGRRVRARPLLIGAWEPVPHGAYADPLMEQMRSYRLARPFPCFLASRPDARVSMKPGDFDSPFKEGRIFVSCTYSGPTKGALRSINADRKWHTASMQAMKTQYGVPAVACLLCCA